MSNEPTDTTNPSKPPLDVLIVAFEHYDNGKLSELQGAVAVARAIADNLAQFRTIQLFEVSSLAEQTDGPVPNSTTIQLYSPDQLGVCLDLINGRTVGEVAPDLLVIWIGHGLQTREGDKSQSTTTNWWLLPIPAPDNKTAAVSEQNLKTMFNRRDFNKRRVRVFADVCSLPSPLPAVSFHDAVTNKFTAPTRENSSVSVVPSTTDSASRWSETVKHKGRTLHCSKFLADLLTSSGSEKSASDLQLIVEAPSELESVRRKWKRRLSKIGVAALLLVGVMSVIFAIVLSANRPRKGGVVLLGSGTTIAWLRCNAPSLFSRFEPRIVAGGTHNGANVLRDAYNMGLHTSHAKFGMILAASDSDSEVVRTLRGTTVAGNNAYLGIILKRRIPTRLYAFYRHATLPNLERPPQAQQDLHSMFPETRVRAATNEVRFSEFMAWWLHYRGSKIKLYGSSGGSASRRLFEEAIRTSHAVPATDIADTISAIESWDHQFETLRAFSTLGEERIVFALGSVLTLNDSPSLDQPIQCLDDILTNDSRTQNLRLQARSSILCSEGGASEQCVPAMPRDLTLWIKVASDNRNAVEAPSFQIQRDSCEFLVALAEEAVVDARDELRQLQSRDCSISASGRIDQWLRGLQIRYFTMSAETRAAPTAPSAASSPAADVADRPLLVVGMVVDQFASWIADERIPMLPSSGGFARLRREGTWHHRMLFAHSATDTAPGHVALYSGTPPTESGVFANDRTDEFDRKLSTFATAASGQLLLATGDPVAGGVSANWVRTELVADRLHRARPNVEIIGLSLKDRGAVPGCGSSANDCIWFDVSHNSFATSTAYGSRFPAWALGVVGAEALRSKQIGVWEEASTPWLPNREAIADRGLAEGDLGGFGIVFPHDFRATTRVAAAFRASPRGDDTLLSLAETAIRSAMARQKSVFLSVSLSSFDYIGHVFGAHSRESFDELYRLDQRLAVFFRELDRVVGPRGWALILSADHGAAVMPELPLSQRTWCGPASPDPYDRPCTLGIRVDPEVLQETAQRAATRVAGAGRWIAAVSDPWVYFGQGTRSLIPPRRAQLVASVRAALLQVPGVSRIIDPTTIRRPCAPSDNETVDALVCRSIPADFRDGLYVLLDRRAIVQPDYVPGAGGAHGSPYRFDRTVPLFVRDPSRLVAGDSSAPIPYTEFRRHLLRLLEIEQRRDATAR